MDSTLVSSENYRLSSAKHIDAPLPIYPPLYATPPQQRPPSPSPSSFSPSPYLLNRKGRSLLTVTQIRHDSSNDRKSVSNGEPLVDLNEGQPDRKSSREEHQGIRLMGTPNLDENKENFEVLDAYGHMPDEFFSRQAMAVTRGTVKDNQVRSGHSKVSDESLAVEEIKQVIMASTRGNKSQSFNGYDGPLTGYAHGYQRESSSSSMDGLETKEKVAKKHMLDGHGGNSYESLSTVEEWLQQVSSSSSLSSPFSSSSSLEPSQTKEKDQIYNGYVDLEISDDSLSKQMDDRLQGTTTFGSLSLSARLEVEEGRHDEASLIIENLDNGRISASSQTAEEFYDASEEGLLDGYVSEGSNSKSKGLLVARPDMELTLADEVTRRIRAEESLKELQLKWNQMARIFSSIGYSIIDSHKDWESQLNVESLEQFLSERLFVARVVAASVARAAVQAEKDTEFQNVLEAKNREIARLHDKMQIYELVNREMSQRNQEIMEATRRRKQGHKDLRRSIIIGCVGASFLVGTAGLVLYMSMPWMQGTSVDSSDLGHRSIERSGG